MLCNLLFWLGPIGLIRKFAEDLIGGRGDILLLIGRCISIFISFSDWNPFLPIWKTNNLLLWLGLIGLGWQF
jgi:hypothetical protein